MSFCEGKDKAKFQEQFSQFKSSTELINAFLKKRDEADKFIKTDKGKGLSILSFKSDDLNERYLGDPECSFTWLEHCM